ncbi:MAG: arginase family protein [Nitrososphaera sp.]
MQLAVLGVPTNSAGKKSGVANAPCALRKAGLLRALGHSHPAFDKGDVAFATPSTKRDPHSGIIAYGSLVSMVKQVRSSVGRILGEGGFPLVIGGDCPVLLGCLAASVDAFSKTGLLFVDGHEDAYPAHKSPTGEAADMELGFALGLQVPPLLAKAIPTPLVDASMVCMLGLRDKEYLQNANVASLDGTVAEFYSDSALRNSGSIKDLVRKAVDQLSFRADRVWLHIDLDVLSTRSLPAVDYQQPGGLSWDQLEAIGRAAMSSGKIAGCNLTIYNPDLDWGRSAGRIVRCVEKILAAWR